jgi:hypothetical protein
VFVETVNPVEKVYRSSSPIPAASVGKQLIRLEHLIQRLIQRQQAPPQMFLAYVVGATIAHLVVV